MPGYFIKAIGLAVSLYVLFFILDQMTGSFKGAVPFVKYVVVPAILIVAAWLKWQRRIRGFVSQLGRLFH